MKKRFTALFAVLAMTLLAACYPTTHHTTSGGVSYCSRTQGIEIDELAPDAWYAKVYVVAWFEVDGDPCDQADGAHYVGANRLATELTLYKDGVPCAYSPLKWNTSTTDSHSGQVSCREDPTDGDTDEFLAEVEVSFRDGAGNVHTYQTATVAAEF